MLIAKKHAVQRAILADRASGNYFGLHVEGGKEYFVVGRGLTDIDRGIYALKVVPEKQGVTVHIVRSSHTFHMADELEKALKDMREKGLEVGRLGSILKKFVSDGIDGILISEVRLQGLDQARLASLTAHAEKGKLTNTLLQLAKMALDHGLIVVQHPDGVEFHIPVERLPEYKPDQLKKLLQKLAKIA